MKWDLTFFQALRLYLKGTLSAEDLYDVSSEIENIYKKPNKTETELKIEIDQRGENELLYALGVSEDDVWFMNTINSPYSDYEFEDSYSLKDSFMEGYIIFHELDEDNLSKMNELSQILIGEKFNLQSYEFRTEFTKKLYDLFEKEVDSIISDYGYKINDAKTQCMRKKIESDLEELNNEYSFKFYDSDFKEVLITAGNLYSWYARTGLLSESPKQVILKMIESEKKYDLGGWYDYGYECDYDEFFDKKGFNSEVNWQIEKIFDKIEEMSFEGGNEFSEVKEMLDRVSSKFPIGEWFRLPKDKKVQFKLRGVNLDTGRLIVELTKNEGSSSVKKEFSEQNFYYLLYQPSLFDFDELI